VWLEKLKLSKQLVRSVTDAGYLVPKEIQEKTLARIIGGQDVIAIGPEGAGKTTTYILAVLTRLKYGFEEAPRALVLVPDKESVLAVTAQFEKLNQNDTIRVLSLYPAPGMEAQLNALADGADIVVATPDRARAIYLKLGLNLNKILMFVVDDADTIISKGMQLPLSELANSTPKCQRLIFTEVLHSKLDRIIEPYMHLPAIVEVDEMGEQTATAYAQTVYHLPNYRTMPNLLNLILRDTQAPAKTAVFLNTRLNAEKVYNALYNANKNEAAILNPVFFESTGFATVEQFTEQTKYRTLIIAGEGQGKLDLEGIDQIIHYELPEEKEILISRILKEDNDAEKLCFVFATDNELGLIKKIEHAVGQKMAVAPLPIDLIIAKENKEISGQKKAIEEDIKGEAFHEKKASNQKNYNISASKKAKMNKKKKH
jgi:ATP-dependent RNA helicase RhlE